MSLKVIKPAAPTPEKIGALTPEEAAATYLTAGQAPAADPTDTNTTRNKRVSNQDAKRWEDHRTDTTGNPHNVTAAQVGGLTQAQGNNLYQKNLSLFNVRDYGAVGNGVADDTTAFQNAINAAIAVSGKLVIPPPSWYYRITNTLTIQPASGLILSLDIEVSGPSNSIRWYGPANIPVFQAYGWKHSTISGVKVDLSYSTGGGNIVWDIDTTSSLESTSHVTFINSHAYLGNLQNNVGWRLGHVSGGVAAISEYAFVDPLVHGEIGVSGQRGWLIESGNALNNQWFGGYGYNLEKMVTNVSSAGATRSNGGGTMYFYGLGGGYNQTDFEFSALGTYLISGGRFEVGNRFLNVPGAANHPVVIVQGVTIEDYAPSDEILVNYGRPGTLVWDGNYVRRSSGDHTAATFTLSSSSGNKGTLHVRGGAMRASDPFFTDTSGGAWRPEIIGVGRLGTLPESAQLFTRYQAGASRAPKLISANYTATAVDEFLLVDTTAASRVVTLPSAVGAAGKEFIVKNVGTAGNTMTVQGTAGETLDGSSTLTTTVLNDSVRLRSDGTNYRIG